MPAIDQPLPGSLGPCERGEPALRSVLHVFARNEKPGLLIQRFDSGETCSVPFARRYVNAFLIALEGHNLDALDADLPDELRGYRSIDEIADSFAGMPGTTEVIQAETAHCYIDEIRKLIRKTLRKKFGREAADRMYIDPFENLRGHGYRIGERGLVVCMHEARTH